MKQISEWHEIQEKMIPSDLREIVDDCIEIQENIELIDKWCRKGFRPSGKFFRDIGEGVDSITRHISMLKGAESMGEELKKRFQALKESWNKIIGEIPGTKLEVLPAHLKDFAEFIRVMYDAFNMVGNKTKNFQQKKLLTELKTAYGIEPEEKKGKEGTAYSKKMDY